MPWHQVLVFLVTLLSFIAATENANEKPRSGLKWISNSEAKKLLNGYFNENFVRNTNDIRRSYCRAEVDGCYYPGSTWYNDNGDNDNGDAFCFINTKESRPKSQSKTREFQLLYNPGGAAKYSWRPWPQGTGNINFPLEVVKSDETCNLMVGRYNDGNWVEAALVDGKGYVYYGHGSEVTQYWDNNEYDLLVERTATKIELVNLEYGDATKNVTKKFTGASNSISTSVLRNEHDIEFTQSAQLQVDYANSKSWSHSIELATSVGAELEISSPGKELTGGVSARFKFEHTYSNAHGWNGEKSRQHAFTQLASVVLPPKRCAKVSLWMMQTIEDVPYKAKYKIYYNSGPPRVVYDEGVLSNVVHFNGGINTERLQC